jgi:hypothetical protein
MDDVGFRKLAGPRRELEQDPVGIEEVDRPDENTIVELTRHPRRAVVVVEDLPDPMPLAISLSRYSSIRSGATSNATWFIDPTAVTRSPRPGSARAEATPGAAGGAPGNQKKARASPLPMSKKKCCPRPRGNSIVLISGMPNTDV